MMKRRMLPLCLCFLVLLSCCSAPSEPSGAQLSKEPEEASISFFAMDTYITLTAYGKNAQDALAQAQKKITALERLWSVTEEGSDLYALNHAGGQAVKVADETAELLEFALRMSERTKGTLDPTVYPILTAWGFTTGENRIPSEEEITELLSLVGYQNVIQNGTTVQLPIGGMLDFGSVAKGFSGDVITEILRENGIMSAFLNLGGNIQAVGSKPDGANWRIGLQDPESDGIVGVLQISDLAVVTSGAYERYFIGEDGKRYGHIMDPATGYPVENGLLSATVIAEEGRLCDALSTSLFVMGAERAIEYWRQNQDFDMILITESGDMFLTDGVSKNFMVDSNHSSLEVHVISE